MQKTIYLDYSATTPVDPRVAQKMASCLLVDGIFGNPASKSHAHGWAADEAVEEAREQLARLFNCDLREIVFTSGATESDNLAIKGVAEFYKDSFGGKRRHIITSSIEHKAVLDTCAFLEKNGFSVTYLKPTSDGLITPEMVQQAIQPETLLVSIMYGNNEIGTLNDIGGIGKVCRKAGVFFHVDAAQSGGKVPIDLGKLEVDLMSCSGHKMYGPKGVGVLFVRREPAVRLVPQIHGGGHERGMRSGTLATHQIVGMGEAARIYAENGEKEHERIIALRERLWSRLKQLPGVSLNGSHAHRLAGILNVSFAGVDGETLIMALPELSVSTGSACNSATVEPSYVLKAIGLSDELAHSSIRFTVGRYTTRDEIDYAAKRVLEVVEGLRSESVSENR
ncbi:MAG: IscS subfamily cysteine desulfurase [Pseudomonadales bacterium]|nr:IscS subfamily cysteine desulfurase [Pseudomonadales bacterium]